MEIHISDWTHKFQNKTGLDAKANSELYKSKRVNSAASVSSPRTKCGGVHTRRAVRGVEVNILEDARHRTGLLQYNLSTMYSMQYAGMHILQKWN